MPVSVGARSVDGVDCLARMSGWGCRYQIDEQCLLLRKECKPGMPGCVLYKKVTFAKDVAAPRKTAAKAKAKGKGKGKVTRTKA